MTEGTSAARMKALLNRFEGVKQPPPPQKDRIKSSVDAPKPRLTEEAKSARVKSVTLVESQIQNIPTRRYVPRIGPTDSDQVRELKRAILAKEHEIMDMATKLNAIAERLNRVVDIFTASTIDAAPQEPPPKPSEDRVKAFQSANADGGGKKEIAKQKASLASEGTSLAAILAAARSGAGGRVKSEKPKYSKILRDAM